MNNNDRQQLRGMASLMRELIKAHVLNNANLPTKETMEDLADMLGAELIQVIGHYGILFKKKDKKSKYEFIKD